jgi:hypothetical protein
LHNPPQKQKYTRGISFSLAANVYNRETIYPYQTHHNGNKIRLANAAKDFALNEIGDKKLRSVGNFLFPERFSQTAKKLRQVPAKLAGSAK